MLLMKNYETSRCNNDNGIKIKILNSFI